MTKTELKELLTPEFLFTLHSAVECCNWDTDMVVTMQFCERNVFSHQRICLRTPEEQAQGHFTGDLF